MRHPAHGPAASPETLHDLAVALPAGTPILTLQGALPVEHLLPQDRLVTRAGALALRSVTARLDPAPDLVRVSARALGHDRPDDDLLLPAAQPVLVRDWRARALFGSDHATVPLVRLIDGTHIRREPARPVRMIRLGMPRAAVLYAGGLELVVDPVLATA